MFSDVRFTRERRIYEGKGHEGSIPFTRSFTYEKEAHIEPLNRKVRKVRKRPLIFTLVRACLVEGQSATLVRRCSAALLFNSGTMVATAEAVILQRPIRVIL